MTARDDFPGLAAYADNTNPPTALSVAVAGVLDYIDTLRADIVWNYVSAQAGEPDRTRRHWQGAVVRANIAEADADRLWGTVVALRGQQVAESSPVGVAHLAAVAVRTSDAVA